jgi:hypothetical protein
MLIVVVVAVGVVDEDEDEDNKEEEAIGAITAGAAAGDENRDPCFEDIAPAPLLEALAV